MGSPSANIKQAVPFFMVSDMQSALQFYVEGLGFEMTMQWTPRGKIEWCYLRRGGGDLMLQEIRQEYAANFEGKKGLGVSICFMCEDAIALYHEFSSRGLQPSEPFVGNGLWVTGIRDPDGYHIDFESPTDVPEETKYSEWKK